MTATTRSGLFAALILALAAGCSGPSGVDGGAGGGGGTMGCYVDTDCPDSQLFFCNLSTNQCEAGCRQRADCSAERRGQYALAECASGLGCQCDEGKCVPSQCGSDSNCASGQVCRNGSCAAAPDPATVTKCTVTPDVIVTKTGAKAKVWVSAWAGEQPVVLSTGVTWSSLDSSSTISGSGNSAVFTAGSAATTGLIDGVKATIGSINCTAKVSIVSGTVPSGTVRAVVVDELTGRPLSGTTVAATNASGALRGTLATTDANGVANVVVGTDETVSVTAFNNSYNYLTLANYDMASGTRLLHFVLRRNQTDKYGGQKGTFKNVPQTSYVHAGLAGMSIGGSVADLSIPQLLGDVGYYSIDLGDAFKQDNVPLPAGVYLGFNEKTFKGDIAAQGLAGVCTGANAETRIGNGDCGTRSAWALSGDVPFTDLPIDAFTTGGNLNSLDYNKLLARILPIFKRFNSSVIRDVEFSLKAPGTKADGGQDFSPTDFTVKDHEFAQMPLSFNFVVKVPDLPQTRGTYADVVALLGGANVPGRGVVPLGVGVGVNTTPATDGKVDKQPDLSAPGLITMRMAPTHHGIEGTEYGVLALSFQVKTLTAGAAGVSTSGLYGRVPDNQLQFDPTGTGERGPLVLPGPFLATPENAKYNFTSVVRSGIPARTFIFTADPGLAAGTVVRAIFTDANEHRWVVEGDAQAAVNTGFALPDMTALRQLPGFSFADRTFNNGVSNSRSSLTVQLLRLNSAPSTTTGTAVNYKTLVELNDTNADRVTDFTTGFALTQYGRPLVGFAQPDNNATIAKGSTVIVQATNFRLGTNMQTDDGQVKITFTGNASCTAQTGSTDNMGNGQVTFTLPPACTGNNISIKASLVDTEGNAIAPAVEKSITVTITP